MIKNRLSTIHIYFGKALHVQLYTLSSHSCKKKLVRRQLYQTLLKLFEAFRL